MFAQFDSGTKLSRAFLSATRPIGKHQERLQHEPAAEANTEQLSVHEAGLRSSEQRAVRMQEFDEDLKAQMRPLERPLKQDARHQFGELCYSAANVALIIACVLAMIKLIQFVLDSTLYEFGEYILSLAFYRQLIFVLVVVPLVLLVPIYNAMSAFFTWHRDTRQETNEHEDIRRPTVQKSSQADQQARPTSIDRQSMLVIKLTYEIILIILLFIALIFVGPNVRSTNLINNIDLELRRHMRNRYENAFSMPFLDELQLEYECCDQIWYRANLQEWLPTSCYRPNTSMTQVFDRTCAEVIGTLVANRCAVIAACLVISLISLAVLVVLDIIRLLTLKMLSTRRDGRSYEFIGSDARRANQAANASLLSRADDEPAGQRFRNRSEEEQDEDQEEEDQDNELGEELLKPSEIVNRLKLNERDRQELVSSSPIDFDKIEQIPSQKAKARQIESLKQTPAGQPLEDHRGSPTILTRANYVTVRRERSQSPTFMDSFEHVHSDTPSSNGSDQRGPKPIKSVLKKTSSYQKLESELTERQEHLQTTPRWDSDEGDDSNSDYARKLRENSSSIIRQQQTRRSLLNVRFAD